MIGPRKGAFLSLVGVVVGKIHIGKGSTRKSTNGFDSINLFPGDPDVKEVPEKYSGTQRLMSIMLMEIMKDAAKGCTESLGWIFDDPMDGHRYRIPFYEYCDFLNIDSTILTNGIEYRANDIINSKGMRFCKGSKYA